MLYKIITSETKDTEKYGRFLDISAKDVSGETVKGSIWENQKDGSKFPNFEAIKVGTEIDLTMWPSPTTGKISFFLPRPKTASKGGANMTRVMEKKQEGISKSMDRKEDGIKVSSTFRDATILTQVWSQKQPFPTTDEIEAKWVHFRTWLLEHYDYDITDTKAF
jgi:hypothetical protein